MLINFPSNVTETERKVFDLLSSKDLTCQAMVSILGIPLQEVEKAVEYLHDLKVINAFRDLPVTYSTRIPSMQENQIPLDTPSEFINMPTDELSETLWKEIP